MHAHSYQRHRPEQTLLYKLVEECYPAFAEQMACEGRALPDYVRREFDEFLRCGRLEHGFLRVRCDSCHAERLVAFSCKRRGFCPSCGARRMAEAAALLVDEVFPEQPVRQWVLSFPYPLRFLFASRPEVMGKVLGIVYRVISTHLIRSAGFTRDGARSGAVTLIQRFGSALNLNVHFHMLFLDGVYVERPDGQLRFCWVKAPTSAELTQLADTIAHRVGRFLERQGLLERDAENSWLAGDGIDDDAMSSVLGHSITYRIAVGPNAGHKDINQLVADWPQINTNVAKVTWPITGDQTLRLGGIAVEALYMPHSHSTTIYGFYVPSADVAFAPDMMFVNAVPPFGFPDFYYPGYIRALDRLIALKAKHYIPSHMDRGTLEDMIAFRDMTVEFQEVVQDEYTQIDPEAFIRGEGMKDALKSAYDRLQPKYGHLHGFDAMFVPKFGRHYGGAYLGY